MPQIIQAKVTKLIKSILYSVHTFVATTYLVMLYNNCVIQLNDTADTHKLLHTRIILLTVGISFGDFVVMK